MDSLMLWSQPNHSSVQHLWSGPNTPTISHFFPHRPVAQWSQLGLWLLLYSWPGRHTGLGFLQAASQESPTSYVHISHKLNLLGLLNVTLWLRVWWEAEWWQVHGNTPLFNNHPSSALLSNDHVTQQSQAPGWHSYIDCLVFQGHNKQDTLS